MFLFVRKHNISREIWSKEKGIDNLWRNNILRAIDKLTEWWYFACSSSQSCIFNVSEKQQKDAEEDDYNQSATRDTAVENIEKLSMNHFKCWLNDQVICRKDFFSLGFKVAYVDKPQKDYNINTMFQHGTSFIMKEAHTIKIWSFNLQALSMKNK